MSEFTMRTLGVALALGLLAGTQVHAAQPGCTQNDVSEYVSQAKQAEAVLDFRSKLSLYAKASMCGDTVSMYELAWMYFGANDIPGRTFKDYSKAAYWFQKAADLNYPPALAQLGVMYGADGSYGVPSDQVKATSLILRAAQMGDAGAMDNLGFRYMKGLGTPKDQDRAIYWWKRAVAAGGSGGQAAQTWLDLFDKKP